MGGLKTATKLKEFITMKIEITSTRNTYDPKVLTYTKTY